MVGLKRCSLCGDALGRDDEMVKCDRCHVWCHRGCVTDREDDHCPRCDDEAWVTVAGF